PLSTLPTIRFNLLKLVSKLPIAFVWFVNVVSWPWTVVLSSLTVFTSPLVLPPTLDLRLLTSESNVSISDLFKSFFKLLIISFVLF
ncbi:MAG: hypothetical protein K2H51_02285, partial [Malacoplasma sp.]|nr:hypothetical protein [Malacoplasma sp.]